MERKSATVGINENLKEKVRELILLNNVPYNSLKSFVDDWVRQGVREYSKKEEVIQK